MKLEEYKSGEYVKMNDYKAFIPSKINYNWGWDDTKLDKLLAEANRQIGELNALYKSGGCIIQPLLFYENYECYERRK